MKSYSRRPQSLASRLRYVAEPGNSPHLPLLPSYRRYKCQYCRSIVSSTAVSSASAAAVEVPSTSNQRKQNIKDSK